MRLFTSVLTILLLASGVYAQRPSGGKTSDKIQIRVDRGLASSFYCEIEARATVTLDGTVTVLITRNFFRGNNRPVDDDGQRHKLELRNWIFDLGNAYLSMSELRNRMVLPPAKELRFSPIPNAVYDDFVINLDFYFEYTALDKTESGRIQLFINIRGNRPQVVVEVAKEEEIISEKVIVEKVEKAPPLPVRVAKSENAIALEARSAELEVFYNRIFSIRNATPDEIRQMEAEYQSFADFLKELPDDDETDRNYKNNLEIYDLKLGFSLETIQELKTGEKPVVPKPAPEVVVDTNGGKTGFNFDRLIIFILVGVLGLSLLGFLFVKLKKK